MIKTIEFYGLKFKTSFNFKNGVKRGKYFNNLLIESVEKFQEKQKEYFTEKLHVVFSYHIVFKFAAYVILALALFSPVFKIVLASIAIVIFLTSLFLNRKFKNDLFKYSFTLSIYEMPKFIEMLRKDLIKNNNK